MRQSRLHQRTSRSTDLPSFNCILIEHFDGDTRTFLFAVRCGNSEATMGTSVDTGFGHLGISQVKKYAPARNRLSKASLKGGIEIKLLGWICNDVQAMKCRQSTFVQSTKLLDQSHSWLAELLSYFFPLGWIQEDMVAVVTEDSNHSKFIISWRSMGANSLQCS